MILCSVRGVESLANSGQVDRVFTLLDDTYSREREHAMKATKAAGLPWHTFDLSDHHYVGQALRPIADFDEAARLIYEWFSDGDTLLIHCYAGLHRTGMIGYMLLRLDGVGHDEAVAAMCEARPACAYIYPSWLRDVERDLRNAGWFDLL